MKTLFINSLVTIALLGLAGCSTSPESKDMNAEDDYYESSQPIGFVDTDEVINDYYESLYDDSYDMDRAPASVDGEAVWPPMKESQFYKNKKSINMYSNYGATQRDDLSQVSRVNSDPTSIETFYFQRETPVRENREITGYTPTRNNYTSMDQKATNRNTIRKVQEALNDYGHPIAVDGILGTQTRNALSHFQQNNHIKANGELNGKTMGALGIDTTYGERSPASIEEQESAETF